MPPTLNYASPVRLNKPLYVSTFSILHNGQGWSNEFPWKLTLKTDSMFRLSTLKTVSIWR